MALSALVLALASTALAQTFFKVYVSRGRRMIFGVTTLALFAMAQGGFFLALTAFEIGVVYFSMGLVHVMVMALSHLVLGEKVTVNHWVAVLLIVTGLVLYPADALGI